MDIKTFLKSTILQISEAIEELNQELKDPNVAVNPRGVLDANNQNSGSIAENIIAIDFDLSVYVESGDEKGGKIGVFSGILGAGISGAEKELNRTANRIKFTLPVLFPHKKPFQYCKNSL